MKILITGGAGFIGSHVVDKFIALGHKVIVVDNLSTGSKINIHPQAKFYRSNIQDKKLEQIFKKNKPQVILHLAAQINVRRSVDDPLFDAKTNILGTINLLENCVKYKVKKVIFISTGGAIYGDGVKIPTIETANQSPVSPYGIAKLSVEKYLHFYHMQYGLSYTVLRLANVYGPRQNARGEAGVVAIFCQRLKDNQYLLINGSGEQTRDYVYVNDVVSALVMALNNTKTGCYNIGTSRETSVNELAKKLIAISGRNVKTKHRQSLKGEQMRSCLNNDKIKKELDWQPKYDLTKGLQETWQWFSRQ